MPGCFHSTAAEGIAAHTEPQCFVPPEFAAIEAVFAINGRPGVAPAVHVGVVPLERLAVARAGQVRP